MGRFDIDKGHQTVMHLLDGYVTGRRRATICGIRGFCGSCHTADYVGAGAKMARRSPGFPEQVPYQEWQP